MKTSMELQEVYDIANSQTLDNVGDLKSMMATVLDKDNIYKEYEKRDTFKKIDLKDLQQRPMTILFPVYNEEKSLQHSTDALFSSYLPKSTFLNVIFLLNGCTDDSRGELIKQIKKVGRLDSMQLNQKKLSELKDNHLLRQYYELKSSRFSIRIFETHTKGKVNALRIATLIALSNDSKVIISFDSDYMLEPQTIDLLISAATKHIYSGETVALTGAPIMANAAGTGPIKAWFRDHGAWFDQSYNSLFGCCLVLDANWALKNLVDVSVEDYALGLMARAEGYPIVTVERARLWTFKTNTRDDMHQLARSIKGRYQLKNRYPDLERMIEEDHFFMQPIYKRISNILRLLVKKPQKVLKYTWRFIFVEVSIIFAKIDFRQDPMSSDWKTLQSSKSK